MRSFVPNTLTLLNLVSGCFGIVFVFTNDLRIASLMIFISLFFDYFDGMAARLLDVKSDIGKELDSLADLVSFGLLPSMMIFVMLKSTGLNEWSYVAFTIAVFSAYRLAKFNTDARQAENFIGLPTPANAIFWSSFPFIISGTTSVSFAGSMSALFSNPYFIFSCIFVFSFLLIAEIPLFSLKFRNMAWRMNEHRYILTAATVILILSFSYYSIPFIIVLYILISIVQNIFIHRNEIQG